ncbi:hypothetical protein [Streptomyces parvus]|uniref:hypothetical protein n=1 Tax=Streptomyces parvus TaxID=66428 RepID=UPI0035D654B6
MVALILSVVLFPSEDGVSLARFRGSGPHGFKPMKMRVAWSKPPATDRPVRAEIVFHDADPPAP